LLEFYFELGCYLVCLIFGFKLNRVVDDFLLGEKRAQAESREPTSLPAT
jgi:hypothetical protein